MTGGWGATDLEPLSLEHGPWSLELVGDRLENVRFGGVRVLRGIRCVVRDRDWRTFAMTGARSKSIATPSGGFRATVTARAERHGAIVDCTLDLEISDDELRVNVRAETVTAVERNRLGLIVLHPIEEAGTVLEVTHPDGSASTARFGQRISPHQPARDIAALAWERDGVRAELQLAGDVFETEDQRNWTDASFKTYSTPLELPFPVTVPASAVIEHELRLRVTRIDGERSAPTRSPSVGRPRSVAIRFSATGHALPRIATGATTAPGRGAPRPASIRTLGHLVEVPLDSPARDLILDRAIIEADGAELDIRFIASDARAVDDAVRRALSRPSPRIARMGITDDRSHITTPEVWSALVAAAGAHASGHPIPLIGGTRAHFTELNRNHAALPRDVGGLAFSLTPQMHDESTAQLIDSLDVLPQLLEDARLIAGPRPLHIGPITLRARFNAVAPQSGHPQADIDRVGYGAHLDPEATDPRWRSSAAGPWVLAVLERLARPGVASIAIGEAAGPRGVVNGDGLTAAGEVLAWFADFAGGRRLPEAELLRLGAGIAAVAIRTSTGVEVMMGSLRDDDVTVSVSTAESLAAATTIVLAPWSLARASLPL